MTGPLETGNGSMDFRPVLGLAGLGLSMVWAGAAWLLLTVGADPYRYQALMDGMRAGWGLTRLETPRVPPSASLPAPVCPPCAAPAPVVQIVAGEPQAQPALETLMDRQADVLRQALAADQESGALEILRSPGQLLVRLPERSCFLPGRALLEPAGLDLLQRLAAPVAKTPGMWRILAHTDNAPLQTSHFSSHWELAANRAVAVVHALSRNPALVPGRFQLETLADTVPLAPNDSVEHRTLNRRVELVWVAKAP
ncbi:hypothetical protein CCP4SC76_6770011 [Gammaproteobacteria bacterium]